MENPHPAGLKERLESRDKQGNIHDDAYTSSHITYNQWFIDQAAKPNSSITTFATTDATITTTKSAIENWFHSSQQGKQAPEFEQPPQV